MIVEKILEIGSILGIILRNMRRVVAQVVHKRIGEEEGHLNITYNMKQTLSWMSVIMLFIT